MSTRYTIGMLLQTRDSNECRLEAKAVVAIKQTFSKTTTTTKSGAFDEFEFRFPASQQWYRL